MRTTRLAAVRPPTLRDVAQGAGVHPATASRALNPQTRRLVNEETANRVIRVAESLGYRPNPIARSLKTARSATVGLVIPDLTNPLFPPMVRGIEDVIGPAGYSAWVVNTDNDPARERSQIDSLRLRQVEGLIVATARLRHELLEQLHADGERIVLSNRRIAHIAGPQDTSTGLGRHRSYREGLLDIGLGYDKALVTTCAYWTEAEGARALRELLDSGADFTAVLAGNDLLALGCYDVLADRGLTCPADLSVVGFNDIPFVDKVRPALTTIRIPHYEIGAEAAWMLIDTLQDPSRHPRSVLLPVTLQVRESTAAPAAR